MSVGTQKKPFSFHAVPAISLPANRLGAEAIETIETEFGTYKMGRYQSCNQRWYGFIRRGEQVMNLISKEEYECGIRPYEPPVLEAPPF